MQAAEHYGNKSTYVLINGYDSSAHVRLPASAGTSYHVKIVARLWRILLIDLQHHLFHDEEGGQPTNTTTVQTEQIQRVMQLDGHYLDEPAVLLQTEGWAGETEA